MASSKRQNEKLEIFRGYFVRLQKLEYVIGIGLYKETSVALAVSLLNGWLVSSCSCIIFLTFFLIFFYIFCFSKTNFYRFLIVTLFLYVCLLVFCFIYLYLILLHCSQISNINLCQKLNNSKRSTNLFV